MRIFLMGSIFMMVLCGCVDVQSEDENTEDEAQYAEIGEMVTQDSILGLRGITLESVEVKHKDENGVTLYVDFSMENLSDEEKAHYRMVSSNVTIFSDDKDVKLQSYQTDETYDFNYVQEMNPGEKLSGGFTFAGVTRADDADYKITYSFGLFQGTTINWEFNDNEIEVHGDD